MSDQHTSDKLPKGWTYSVTTEPDQDSSPREYECYSAEDIAAWERNEWAYVGVIVTIVDPYGRDWGTASVWSVEDGFTNDEGKTWWAVERTDLIEGLLLEAIEDTDRTAKTLGKAMDEWRNR